MLLIVLVTLFVLLLCWFLLAPFYIYVDTRLPQVYLHWASIGKITVCYDNEIWWLKLQLLFFKKAWVLQQLFSAKPKKRRSKKNTAKRARVVPWQKLLKVMNSFNVLQWNIAIDSDNYPANAWLSPLNFYPPFRGHVTINFNGENYIVLTIRNAPWRILYTWLK